jgi:dTDP-D-glucose 4,6-dehydratase
LRWTPLFSGAKGIHQTVEWYRKNRGWWEPLLETRA